VACRGIALPVLHEALDEEVEVRFVGERDEWPSLPPAMVPEGGGLLVGVHGDGAHGDAGPGAGAGARRAAGGGLRGDPQGGGGGGEVSGGRGRQSRPDAAFSASEAPVLREEQPCHFFKNPLCGSPGKPVSAASDLLQIRLGPTTREETDVLGCLMLELLNSPRSLLLRPLLIKKKLRPLLVKKKLRPLLTKKKLRPLLIKKKLRPLLTKKSCAPCYKEEAAPSTKKKLRPLLIRKKLRRPPLQCSRRARTHGAALQPKIQPCALGAQRLGERERPGRERPGRERPGRERPGKQNAGKRTPFENALRECPREGALSPENALRESALRECWPTTALPGQRVCGQSGPNCGGGVLPRGDALSTGYCHVGPLVRRHVAPTPTSPGLRVP